MDRLEQLRERYQQGANFLIVYIREAHPDDEWQMEQNLDEEIVFNQPKSLDERLQMARTFLEKTEVQTQTLVDDISNPANLCYAAWPERLYVIDQEGTIVYKGGMGPGDFDPGELEEFLAGYLPTDRSE